MNPVGHGAYGYLLLRPSWKQWFENVPAHLPVEFAHAVDLAAAADSKVGHVEVFAGLPLWVPMASNIFHRDDELIFRVMV